MISISNTNVLTYGKEYFIITKDVDGKTFRNRTGEIPEYWVCNDFGIYLEIDIKSFIDKIDFRDILIDKIIE